jgi:methyl-accepting chemotaxis protein
MNTNMRTFSIVMIPSLLSAGAGALSVIALSQSSLAIMLTMIGSSLAVSLAALAWGVFKFRRGLRRMENQSLSSDSAMLGTGILELDHIGKQFSNLLNQTRESAQAASVDLAEVKLLLNSLDRRARDNDRNGEPIDCATKLRSILKGCSGELDSHIRQTISCGREIFRATEEIVSGSESQADTVDQTATYIERLSAQIMSVCDNAEEALASSSRAETTAQSGLQAFQDLVEKMKQIRNQASAREKKLQALGQHTKEIESIVQTIGTLSSRTDLLALNASIESVRAGEHGRGFAVVAEEVRALAEQSAQAVLDISHRIEMIQLETHQSISVASGEHDQMQDVIKRVSETLNSLQDICESAAHSANGLNEISDSTTQQLQLTREIIVALERSTETSKKNRSRAEGANWTAKTLGQIGEQLGHSLDLLRLTEAPTLDVEKKSQSAALLSSIEETQTPALT